MAAAAAEEGVTGGGSAGDPLSGRNEALGLEESARVLRRVRELQGRALRELKDVRREAFSVPKAHRRGLGTGAFGDVFHGVYREAEQVALKRLFRWTDRTDEEVEVLRGECSVHQNVSHPNLLSLLGVCFGTRSAYLLSELAQANMATILHRNREGRPKPLPIRLKLAWIKDIASGLRHLHHLGLLHRALTPKNVLVFPNDCVKISDYGFAQLRHDLGKLGYGPRLWESPYVAPELWEQRTPHFTDSSDVYALGVIALEITSEVAPTLAEKDDDDDDLDASVSESIPQSPETIAASAAERRTGARGGRRFRRPRFIRPGTNRLPTRSVAAAMANAAAAGLDGDERPTVCEDMDERGTFEEVLADRRPTVFEDSHSLGAIDVAERAHSIDPKLRPSVGDIRRMISTLMEAAGGDPRDSEVRSRKAARVRSERRLRTDDDANAEDDANEGRGYTTAGAAAFAASGVSRKSHRPGISLTQRRWVSSKEMPCETDKARVRRLAEEQLKADRENPEITVHSEPEDCVSRQKGGPADANANANANTEAYEDVSMQKLITPLRTATATTVASTVGSASTPPNGDRGRAVVPPVSSTVAPSAAAATEEDGDADDESDDADRGRHRRRKKRSKHKSKHRRRKKAEKKRSKKTKKKKKGKHSSKRRKKDSKHKKNKKRSEKKHQRKKGSKSKKGKKETEQVRTDSHSPRSDIDAGNEDSPRRKTSLSARFASLGRGTPKPKKQNRQEMLWQQTISMDPETAQAQAEAKLRAQRAGRTALMVAGFGGPEEDLTPLPDLPDDDVDDERNVGGDSVDEDVQRALAASERQQRGDKKEDEDTSGSDGGGKKGGEEDSNSGSSSNSNESSSSSSSSSSSDSESDSDSDSDSDSSSSSSSSSSSEPSSSSSPSSLGAGDVKDTRADDGDGGHDSKDVAGGGRKVEEDVSVSSRAEAAPAEHDSGLTLKKRHSNRVVVAVPEDKDTPLAIGDHTPRETNPVDVIGSAASDKLAVVAIYESTGGKRWRNPWRLRRHWLSRKPVKEWYGIRVNASGRINCLDLYENNVTGDLPWAAGTLTALAGLQLGKNHIESLPESVSNWTALRELNLRECNLSTLPDGVGGWACLRYLDLFDNQLSVLPATIGSWTALEKLNLRNNDLIWLPKSAGHWSSVKEVNLADNEIKSLPQSVSRWTTLEALYLSRETVISPAVQALKDQGATVM